MISKRHLVLVKREVEEKRINEIGRRSRNVLFLLLLLALPQWWFIFKSESHNFSSIADSDLARLIASSTSNEQNKENGAPTASFQDDLISSAATPPMKAAPIDWDQYDHVHFYHTRKAGGTTLTKWTRTVAYKHNKTHSSDEGFIYEGEDWLKKHYGRVLYITSLRKPIRRALSTFAFEAKAETVEGFIREANDTIFGKRAKYGRNSYGLMQGHDNRVDGRKRGRLWMCASECYTQWFGSYKNDSSIPQEKVAAEVLDHFEIIWLDDLSNPEYLDWMRTRLNATDVDLPHKRPTKTIKNYTLEEDVDRLRVVNPLDIALYNRLRQKWASFAPLNATVPDY